MLRYLLIASVLLLFTGFMPPKESFEGIITYKITCISKLGSEEYAKHQGDKFGKSLKVTIFKNGNFKREYPSSSLLFGTDFNIYMQATNVLYTKMRSNDTVKAYDCSKNPLIQKEESEKPDEVINGVNCKSYYISGGDSRSRQPTALHYFYPTDKEFIDWKLYANFNDLFYNKVIFKMQAPFYKLVVDLSKYTLTYEIEKIEIKKLSPDLLKFPAGKPVKEL